MENEINGANNEKRVVRSDYGAGKWYWLSSLLSRLAPLLSIVCYSEG